MFKLIFPYTFVSASGLHPAQFSYTGTMIRTVDSYFCICPDGNGRRENARSIYSSGRLKRSAVSANQPCLQSL